LALYGTFDALRGRGSDFSSSPRGQWRDWHNVTCQHAAAVFAVFITITSSFAYKFLVSPPTCRLSIIRISPVYLRC
jgi:hypothetical protein